MLEITDAVHAFRRAVLAAYPAVDGLARQDRSLVADWLQANWETIVEASIAPHLGVRLEIYGDGADCNERSSRVWRPQDVTTHQVVCVSPNGLFDALTGTAVTAGLPLDRFCTLHDSYPQERPPFDLAQLQSDELSLVAVADLRFFARSV